MGTTWLEALPENQKRVIVRELVHGWRRATELQSLLPLNNRGGYGENQPSPLSAEELLMEIVTSFTQSLSVLSDCSSKLCGGDDRDHHEYSGTGDEVVKAEVSQVSHSHCGDRSSENSGQSRKRPGLKDRRGCYKRRKNSESRTVVSPTVDDGQAWRKYGQKEILNAPYPRAYFRCTCKYDQGCQATKQVQQLQDTPKMYKTTYIGSHTCISIIKGPQMIMGACSDPPTTWEPRATVSSESGSTPSYSKNKHHGDDHGGHGHLISSSSSLIPSTLVKNEECKQERAATTRSDVTDNPNDTIDVWPGFRFTETATVMSNEDVVSDMHYLDMDLDLVKSIDFDNEFHFDETTFPLC